jgi:hypothetical protein
MKDVVQKHDLEPYIVLNTEVVGAEWVESAQAYSRMTNAFVQQLWRTLSYLFYFWKGIAKRPSSNVVIFVVVNVKSSELQTLMGIMIIYIWKVRSRITSLVLVPLLSFCWGGVAIFQPLSWLHNPYPTSLFMANLEFSLFRPPCLPPYLPSPVYSPTHSVSSIPTPH